MKVEKKDLGKGQLELEVIVPFSQLKGPIEKAVEQISQSIKIEGFRPGKATYDLLKQKVGEVAIMEEAARVYISKHLEKIITDHSERPAIGQPQISIIKLAPENPLEFKITLSLLPEVTLGKYKELGLKQTKVEADQADVDKLLTELKEMRVREEISEEPIKDTDKAIIDINISLDKVPVDGGQSKDTAIVIGKNYVVLGFDKELIGLKSGEEKEFKLPYPENHHQKNLAGKIVEFKVKVKEVFTREMPELNDEFALGFGVKKIEELQEDIKRTITQEKQEKENQKTEIELLNKITETTKFGDLPEEVVKHEGEVMMNELKHNVEHQGAKFEDYLSSMKKTEAQLMLDMMPDAVKRIKTALLMREIAEVEKISVDQKEVEHEIEHILTHYRGNKEAEAKVQTPEYKNYLTNSMTNRKVIQRLREWNVEGEPKAEEHVHSEHCNH